MSDYLRDRVTAAVGAQYLIEGEIGRGGMAVVYRALDLRLHRQVAIKVLPPELAFTESVRERFLREAQTAAQLTHPNIVQIYAVDERDGVVYFVMALVEGESLAAHLARDVRWAPDRAARLLRDVADALAYAHERGVVHRDIKPDNILIDRASGRPLVTDFGIARAAAGETRLTVTGVAVGTPAYMSPEQAIGERELDGRSDLYSLGVVGYQMLCGETPFKASNTPAMLVKHVSERPRPVREVRADVPRYLAVAVDRALKKRPEDRWSSAGELRDAIDGAEAGTRARAPEREEHEPMSLVPMPEIPIAAPTSYAASFPPPPPGLSRKELKHWHKTQRRLLLVQHGMMHRGGQGYDDLPLEHRVTAFRRSAARFFVISGVLFVINASMGGVPWFFIPAGFLLLDTMRKLGSIWSDGVGPLDAFKKGIRARLRAYDAQAGVLPPASAVQSAPNWSKAPAPRALAPMATPQVPSDVLAGPHGPTIRRALADRTMVRDIVETLGVVEREMIPDVAPTADALVERVASLAITLHRLDADVSGSSLGALDQRIASLKSEPETGDRERRLSLLERQRASLHDLLERRRALLNRMESASLSLQNIKLDLLKLRSSGIGSTINDVTSATQEARALSREIGHVLDASDDLRKL